MLLDVDSIATGFANDVSNQANIGSVDMCLAEIDGSELENNRVCTVRIRCDGRRFGPRS